MSKKVEHWSTVFLLATAFSLIFSVYALYVEKKHEERSDYKPLCDISERISCSKAFNSRFAKGFGLFDKESTFNIANPIYGLLFYKAQLLIHYVGGSDIFANTLLLLLSIISNVISVYLAYILYQMNNLCVVCAAIYCTNAVSLIASIYRWRFVRKLNHKQE